MVRAWRLVQARFAGAAFDGEGARQFGGRWNSPGTSIAYGSDSVALATLEVLVHLQAVGPLVDFRLACAEFSPELVEPLEVSKLPKDWDRFPSPPEVQAVGDSWCAGGRSCVLRVPSAIVPEGSNYLFNPAHPDFARVVIRPAKPFRLDSRLLRG